MFTAFKIKEISSFRHIMSIMNISNISKKDQFQTEKYNKKPYFI